MAPRDDESEPSVSTSKDLEDASRRFDELLHQAQASIDRINQLYQNYLSGVEKIPLHEPRAKLEKNMDQLQSLQRPTAQHRFRYSSLRSSYLTIVSVGIE